jgi:large subunit ribosomal protein L25
MAGVQLAVDQRTIMGKRLGGLRRKGIMPAHLYGHGIDSLALQAPTATIINLLRTAGRNDIIDLQIAGEGQARPVMLRGVQRDPVSDALVHIDFFQISLTERLRADVPLSITGEAPAVQVYGGILLQSLDRVTVEALPADIPSHFEIDISGLAELDTAIHVSDLKIPENVVLVSDPDQVIVKVATPKLAAEEEAAAPAVEGEEAAAAAEGAAPAAEGAAAEEKSE